MPCQGPSDAEMREYERENNLKRFGIRASLLDITTRVACESIGILTSSQIQGASNLLRKWKDWHDVEDRKRKDREEQERKRKLAKKEIEAASASILKKHGLK